MGGMEGGSPPNQDSRPGPLGLLPGPVARKRYPRRGPGALRCRQRRGQCHSRRDSADSKHPHCHQEQVHGVRGTGPEPRAGGPRGRGLRDGPGRIHHPTGRGNSLSLGRAGVAQDQGTGCPVIHRQAGHPLHGRHRRPGCGRPSRPQGQVFAGGPGHQRRQLPGGRDLGRW